MYARVIESSVVFELRAAGCVFAEEEARLLLAEASTEIELKHMVQRRISGLPLEQILGWAQFCELRLLVAPQVFVPRRRTEFLAKTAIGLVEQREHPVVLDLCCGVAAIAAAIAAQISSVELYAADVQPAAVQCAQRNLGDRGQVFYGDLFEPLPESLRGRVDILVANAPYVPTGQIMTLPAEARLFESRITLDGGSDGLALHRRIAEGATDWLVPGGRLLVECSAGQADDVVEIFASHGLAAVVVRDEALDATVVIGHK